MVWSGARENERVAYGCLGTLWITLFVELAYHFKQNAMDFCRTSSEFEKGEQPNNKRHNSLQKKSTVDICEEKQPKYFHFTLFNEMGVKKKTTTINYWNCNRGRLENNCRTEGSELLLGFTVPRYPAASLAEGGGRLAVPFQGIAQINHNHWRGKKVDSPDHQKSIAEQKQSRNAISRNSSKIWGQSKYVLRENLKRNIPGRKSGENTNKT